MKKYIFLILAVVMLAFYACDGDNNPAAEQSTVQDDGSGVQTELTVWGMTCSSCVARITNELSEMDEIISVSADFRADTVLIEHYPELDIDLVESVITSLGFNMP